jgi:hypothetical protein
MEFGPAEDSCECKEQQHGVQQNETTDRGVGVLAQNHQGDEPNGKFAEVELLGRVVSDWHAHCTKGGVENAHECVVQVFWVSLTRLEFEGTVVASEVAGETDEHLSERRVNIKVEFALEVVGTELAETVFISLALL